MAKSGKEVLKLVGIDLNAFYKMHGAAKAREIEKYMDATRDLERLFESGEVLREEALDAVRNLITAANSMAWYDEDLSKKAKKKFEKFRDVADEINDDAVSKDEYETILLEVKSEDEARAAITLANDGAVDYSNEDAFEFVAKNAGDTAILAFANVLGYEVVVLVDGSPVKPGDEIDADETIKIIYNGQIDHGTAMDFIDDPEIEVSNYIDEGRIEITIGGETFIITGDVNAPEFQVENDGVDDEDLDLSIKVNGKEMGDFFFVEGLYITYQGKEVKPGKIDKIRGIDVDIDEKDEVVTVSYDGGVFRFFGKMAITAFSADDKSTKGTDFMLLVDKNGVERLDDGVSLKYDKKVTIIIDGEEMKMKDLFDERDFQFDADAEEGTIEVKYPGGRLNIVVKKDDFPDMFVFDDDGETDSGATSPDLIIYDGGEVFDTKGGGLKTTDLRIYYLDEEMSIEELLEHKDIIVTVGTDEETVTINYGFGTYTLRGKLAVDLFSLGIATIDNPSEWQAATFIKVDGDWQDLSGKKAKIKLKEDLDFYVKGEEVSFAEFVADGSFAISIDNKGKKVILSSPDQVIEIKGNLASTGMLGLIASDYAGGTFTSGDFDFGEFDYFGEDTFVFGAWAAEMGQVYGNLSDEGLTGTSVTIDPDGMNGVSINFDFFELGTWDGAEENERLTMTVNGVDIDLGTYSHKIVESNREWSIDPDISITRTSSASKTIEGTGTVSRGQDQVHRFTVELGPEAMALLLPDGQTELSVSFSASIGQRSTDENYGIAQLDISMTTAGDTPSTSSSGPLWTPENGFVTEDLPDWIGQESYDADDDDDFAKIMYLMEEFGIDVPDMTDWSRGNVRTFWWSMENAALTMAKALSFRSYYEAVAPLIHSWNEAIAQVAEIYDIDLGTAEILIYNRFPGLISSNTFLAVKYAVDAYDQISVINDIADAILIRNPHGLYSQEFLSLMGGIGRLDSVIQQGIEIFRGANIDEIQNFFNTQNSLENSFDINTFGADATDDEVADIRSDIYKLGLISIVVADGQGLYLQYADYSRELDKLDGYRADLVASLTPPFNGMTPEQYLSYAYTDEEILSFLEGITQVFENLQVVEQWAEGLLDAVQTNFTREDHIDANLLAIISFYLIGSAAGLAGVSVAAIAYFAGSATALFDVLSKITRNDDSFEFDGLSDSNENTGDSILDSFALILHEAEARVELAGTYGFTETLRSIEGELGTIEEQSTKAADALEKYAGAVQLTQKVADINQFDFDRTLAVPAGESIDDYDGLLNRREKERFLEEVVFDQIDEWDDEFEEYFGGNVDVGWNVSYTSTTRPDYNNWPSTLDSGSVLGRGEYTEEGDNLSAFRAVFSGGIFDELHKDMEIVWHRDTKFSDRFDDEQTFTVYEINWI